MCMPEAYENRPARGEDAAVVDFYDYYSGVLEAWDGPALVAFSDGCVVGAAVDRNGLRPARFARTRSGLVLLASEAGAAGLPAEEVLERGRLGPGEMLAVDLEAGELLRNGRIKPEVAAQKPYGAWLSRHRRDAAAADEPPPAGPAPPTCAETLAARPAGGAPALLRRQTAAGFTAEDVDMILLPMAQRAREPRFSMGNDAPLPILSSKPHTLYDYFAERFAQVTNPPIDPLRERLVMSLAMRLGARGNLLTVGTRARPPAGTSLADPRRSRTARAVRFRPGRGAGVHRLRRDQRALGPARGRRAAERGRRGRRAAAVRRSSCSVTGRAPWPPRPATCRRCWPSARSIGVCSARASDAAPRWSWTRRSAGACTTSPASSGTGRPPCRRTWPSRPSATCTPRGAWATIADARAQLPRLRRAWALQDPLQDGHLAPVELPRRAALRGHGHRPRPAGAGVRRHALKDRPVSASRSWRRRRCGSISRRSPSSPWRS